MKIIITGSEGIIGQKLVPLLTGNGHKIVKCDRDLGHDLSDKKCVESFFETHRADALINLFALDDKLTNNTKSDTVWDFSLDLFMEYMETNVVSLFSVCREFAKHNDSGSIINFSSIYGVVSPDYSLYELNKHKHIGYCVSKAAVLQMSRYLAVHLVPCRVNSIVCGAIENKQELKFVERFSKRVPIGRMMSADELVGLVEYLCSNKSSYCTGGEFTIDGGYTIW